MSCTYFLRQRKNELEPPCDVSNGPSPFSLRKRGELQHPHRIVAFILLPFAIVIWVTGWTLTFVATKQERRIQDEKRRMSLQRSKRK
jgi:hypothetical protein